MVIYPQTISQKNNKSFIVAGAMAQGKVFGANNRIRMCTIGFNGQGHSHINDILALKDEAEYVALCDVDSQVRERGSATVKKAQGKEPKVVQGHSRSTRDKEMDAVTIATRNHLAYPGGDLGMPGRKGCYMSKSPCRIASTRAAIGGGGAKIQTDSPARHTKSKQRDAYP